MKKIRARSRHTAPARTRRSTRKARPLAAALARSLVLGTAVFTLGAVAGGMAGGMLGSTTPAAGHSPPLERLASEQQQSIAVDATFAHSMVFSGAAALAVSVAGVVIVARRRRAW